MYYLIDIFKKYVSCELIICFYIYSQFLWHFSYFELHHNFSYIKCMNLKSVTYLVNIIKRYFDCNYRRVNSYVFQQSFQIKFCFWCLHLELYTGLLILMEIFFCVIEMVCCHRITMSIVALLFSGWNTIIKKKLYLFYEMLVCFGQFELG